MRVCSGIIICALLAAPLCADGQLRSARGPIDYLHYNYDTGQISTTTTPRTRNMHTVWDARAHASYYLIASNAEILLDWGDISDGTQIASFTFAYGTTSTQAAGAQGPIDIDVVFYNQDNGFNSTSRSVVTALRLLDLPGVVPSDPNSPGQSASIKVVTVDLGAMPFMLSGPDLDNPPGSGTGNNDPNVNAYIACVDTIGLSDFGYSFHFRSVGDGSTGPVVVQPGEPNLPQCPAMGAMNAYDAFEADPNNPPADPNAIAVAGQGWAYQGSFDVADRAFSQWYLTLQTDGPSNCPIAGCELADIEPIGGDCDVDLADLALMLGEFGTASCTGCAADLDGDGDVDLTDLAAMLSAFGNLCR